jgi:hypothetical protein
MPSTNLISWLNQGLGRDLVRTAQLGSTPYRDYFINKSRKEDENLRNKAQERHIFLKVSFNPHSKMSFNFIQQKLK